MALHIRWPKYWSFSFSISPSNEYSGLISFRIDWFDLLEKTLKSLLQNHQLSLAPPEMQMCECWELILQHAIDLLFLENQFEKFCSWWQIMVIVIRIFS